LSGETNRHTDAAVASSLEDNERLFAEERDRLDKWAEDKVFAAEKDLDDTRSQVKALKRQARLAKTLDEQAGFQVKIRNLEKKQHRQREQIFEIEDEIDKKRDEIIAGLQKRMSQKTTNTPLFTIRWRVI
jgi:predicted  nucleic acid-binding Zn-ribbon protein